MDSQNQFLCYNDCRVRQSDIVDAPTADHFHDSTGMGGLIPPKYLQVGVERLLDQCYKPFKDLFAREGFERGMQVLRRYDQHSARSFMLTEFNVTDGNFVLQKEAYPPSVINWLERMSTGTGLLDMVFSEMVLDDLQFDYPGAAIVDSGGDAPASNTVRGTR
ncbi:hypothetical protein AAF712_014207 [Marasmius tenuissimus]|uniref:Uncharacterized protein n=1 Tax=Marasmius tenuissimus TaxID=585030 RepID=A0ABR2ZBP9_9AGAR